MYSHLRDLRSLDFFWLFDAAAARSSKRCIVAGGGSDASKSLSVRHSQKLIASAAVAVCMLLCLLINCSYGSFF